MNEVEGASVAYDSSNIIEFPSYTGARPVMGYGDLWVYQCPLSLITEDSIKILDACYLIEMSGALLWRGGWSDQPEWLVEAFKIYKSEIKQHGDNVDRR